MGQPCFLIIMFNYYLDLIGLKTLLQAPMEITVSDRLSPFLCQPFNKADCVISLIKTEKLPTVSDKAIKHSLCLYDTDGENDMIFHIDSESASPFAVTEFCVDGNIRISVLKEYIHYFSGSGGIFNRIGMENLLLKNNGLLVHSSVIEYGGKGILFMGASGVGKSTQAQLWQKTLGAQIINGDRAALRKTADGWTVFGSPFAGTSGIYKNKKAPVLAAVLLRQSKTNKLTRLSQMEALRLVYPEISIHRWDKRFVNNATELFLDFAEKVPFYLLECEATEQAVILLKEGLDL